MNDFANVMNSLYNTVMYLAPGFIWLLITMFLLWLSYKCGVKHSDSIWKNNIKYHLSKVSKDEIETRDKKIGQLQYLRDKYKKENDKMRNIINAMKGITEVMEEGDKS